MERKSFHKKILFSLILAALFYFSSAVSADEISNTGKMVDLHSSISNSPEEPVVPYRSGMIYDRQKLNGYGSVRSLFPSASVEIKSQGSPGQLSSVSLDGGLPSHTTLAIDGLPIDNAQLTPFDVGLLPSEFFRSADIYRNNLVPFGYSGSSGLINFIMDKPGKDEQEVQLFGGSYGNYGGKLQVSRSAFGFDYLFGGSFTMASNNFTYIDSWDATNTAVNMDYTKYSLVGKIRWNELGLNATYTSKEGGTGSGSMMNARQSDGLLTLDTEYKLAGFQAGVSYLNWLNRYSDPGLSDNESHLNQTFTVNAAGILKTGPYGFKPKVINKFFSVRSSVLGDRLDDEVSVVADNGLDLGVADVGFVLNQVYRFSGYYVPIPALDMTWKMFEPFRITASAGRGFRYPTFNDLYWPADSFAKGNPDLKPEDGWLWKTGLMAFFYPFYSVLTYSESYLNNLIVWMPGQSGKWSPQNVGTMISRVLSLDCNLNLKAGLFSLLLNASYSMNYSYNNDSSSLYYLKRILYIPLYKLAFGLTMDYDRLTGLNVSVRQVSERFTTEDNSSWLPPYLTADVKFYFSIAFISVENVFDVSYQEIQGYPQPGRTFRAGIDWVF